MSSVILLDTSIYLNILGVPGSDQMREEVLTEVAGCYMQGDNFILPLATIWETGNNISRLPNGYLRRTWANNLYIDVQKAFDGQVPYRATYFPERVEFLSWLETFPDRTMTNKSPEKITEGPSLVDHSIIKEWERTCNLNPMRRVRIWSLDSDLGAYDKTV